MADKTIHKAIERPASDQQFSEEFSGKKYTFLFVKII